jgi:hypothetical protein
MPPTSLDAQLGVKTGSVPEMGIRYIFIRVVPVPVPTDKILVSVSKKASRIGICMRYQFQVPYPFSPLVGRLGRLAASDLEASGGGRHGEREGW